MPEFISDSPLARDLSRIGDDTIVHENEAQLPGLLCRGLHLHGPGGDLGFEEELSRPNSRRCGRPSATCASFASR